MQTLTEVTDHAQQLGGSDLANAALDAYAAVRDAGRSYVEAIRAAQAELDAHVLDLEEAHHATQEAR